MLMSCPFMLIAKKMTKISCVIIIKECKVVIIVQKSVIVFYVAKNCYFMEIHARQCNALCVTQWYRAETFFGGALRPGGDPVLPSPNKL